MVENITGKPLADSLSQFGQTAPVTTTTLAPAPVLPSPQQIATRLLSDPEFAQSEYAKRKNGNQTVSDEVMNDFETATFGDLAQKYGEEVAYSASSANAAKLTVDDKLDVDRSIYDTALDLSSDVFTGAVTSGANLLGAGLTLEGEILNKLGSEDNYLSKWGNAIIGKSNEFSEFAKSRKSQEDQDRDQILGYQREGDKADNTREVAAWKDANPDTLNLVSGLHQFGKDFLDEGATLLQNPTAFASVAAEGLGSLATSAPIAGAAAKVAAPFIMTKTEAALVKQLGGLSGGEKVANALARSAVPASIALSESSGVHAQTVNAVMGMSFDELAANSPDYQELIAQDISPEDARMRVANATGIKAATIQFPVAMLAGIGVSKFEASPLTVGSRSEAIGNLFKETAEEMIQGGTGEVSSNLAVSLGADVTQTLSEGVGQSTAQGAAGGFGMVAGTQGPALALDAAISTVSETAQAANELGDGIGNIIAKGVNGVKGFANEAIEDVKKGNQERLDAGSAVGNKATKETLAATVEATNAAVAELASTPEDEAGQSTLKALQDGVFFNDAAVNSQSKTVKGIVAGITEERGITNDNVHRMEVLERVMDKLQDKNTPEDEQNDLGVYLLRELERYADFSALAEESGAGESPLFKNVAEVMESTMGIVGSNPKIMESLSRLAALDQSEDQAPDALTPEGVELTDALADVNPAGVNPATVKMVLNQEDDGTGVYNEPRKKKLKVAGNFSERASQDAKDRIDIEQERIDGQNEGREEKAKLKSNKDYKEVRDEIIAKDYKLVKADGSTVTLPSLSKHLINVTNAIKKGVSIDQNGIERTAAEQLLILRNFAQHQMNKLGAINQSAEISMTDKGKDNQVGYQSVNINNPVEMNADSSFVKKSYSQPTNKNHVQTARYIEADANLAIQLHNDLVETYPELGGEALPLAALDTRYFPKRNKVEPNVEEAVVVDNEAKKKKDPVVSKPPLEGAELAAAEAEITKQETQEREAAARDLAQRNLLAIPDDVLTQAMGSRPYKGIAKLAKYPLVDMVVGRLGRLDRNSDLAKELATQDITPATFPRLFARQGQGVKNYDNLPAEEAGDYQYLLEDDGNGYLSEQAIIDAIISETAGVPLDDFAQASAREAREAVDEIIAEAAKAGETPEKVKADNKADRRKNVPVVEDIEDQSEMTLVNGSGEKKKPSKKTQVIVDDLDVKPNADGLISDDNGQVVTFYHGTKAEFDSFADNENGIFLSTRKGQGREYALGGGGRLIAVNVTATNPLLVEAPKGDDAQTAWLTQTSKIKADMASGNHDAVIIQDSTGDAIVVVFNGDQVIITNPDVDGSALAEVDPVEVINPNLVKDSKGKNRILETFKRIKGKSKIGDLLSPLSDLLALIEKGDDAIHKFMASPSEYRMTRKRLIQSKELMDKFAPDLITAMNKRMTTVMWDKDNNVSMMDALKNLDKYTAKDGVSNVLSAKRGMALSLVDGSTMQYDQRLVEGAVLAGLNYAITSFNGGYMSRADIAELSGIPEENINYETIQAYNFGKSVDQIREEMGREIQRFWGVKTSDSDSLSNTQGIAEAIASELFLAMSGDLKNYDKDNQKPTAIENGDTGNVFFIRKKFTVPNTNGFGGFKTLISITHNTTLNAKIKETMGPAVSFLEDMSFADKSNTRARIGSKHTSLPQTQKNNRYTDLTDYEHKTLRALQDIAFKRNAPFLGLMSALGIDNYSKLLGSKSEDDTLTNKVDLQSIIGKNTSIRNGFEGVMEHDARVKEWAIENGADENQTPTYYNWYITKVGRHHMEGFGPQADKTAREAFIATVSTLDMTTPEGQDLFWMTVAQSSGIVKTEKTFRKDSIEKIKTDFTEKYGNALDAVSSWYTRSRETGNPTEAMTEAEVAELEYDIGGDGTAKLLHSLLAVAKFMYAHESGDPAELTQFEHMLSLEADGKTDGPMNAMMHYVTGAFSEYQLKLLTKGGWFVNVADKSLNDHYAEGGDSKNDLYQEAATLLQKRLIEIEADIRSQGNREVIAKFEAMMNLLVNFGDVKRLANGEYEIGRNVLKNPLTITVYGSGQKGIAGNVVNELLDGLYTAMTAELVGDPESKIRNYKGNFQSDVTALFGKPVKVTREGRFYINNKAKIEKLNFSDKVGFEITPSQFSNASTTALSVFVTPMHSAIQMLMGETQLTTEFLQKATQLQSAVMIQMFQRRVYERLVEVRKSEGYNKSDFLSDKELGEIYRELMPYGAVIGDDFQPMDVGTSRRGESDYLLGFALDSQMDGASTIQSPTMAGVRISPALTISRGDANMMNIYYQMIDHSIRTLPVFDGQETAADEMDKVSHDMNKASFMGWQINAIRPVSNSFAAFMRLDPLGEFDAFELGEIHKRISPNQGTDDPLGSLQVIMKVTNEVLHEKADQRDARIEVMETILSSTDHMASAESAYTHQGDRIEGDIVAEMNKRYRAAYAKIVGKKEKGAVDTQNQPFMDLVSEYGEPVEELGLTVMGRDTFMTMMENDKNLSDDLKLVLETLDGNIPEGMSFVFGSPEDLTNYRNMLTGDTSLPAIQMGQTDFQTNTVYIANQSAETALHEALHAATFRKVYNYYSNETTLGKTGRDAMKRLEVFMEEFMNSDLQYDTAELQDAANAAKVAIQKWKNKEAENGPLAQAAAINEFMAWTLTNDNLIRLGKETRNMNVLTQLGKKVKILMARLFGYNKGDVFSNVLFNTKLVMDARGKDNFRIPATVQLNQQYADTNERLVAVSTMFNDKITKTLENSAASSTPFVYENTEFADIKGMVMASNTAAAFTANGFPMNALQRQTFMSIMSGMSSLMEMDNLSLVRAQKLYDLVMEDLTPQDFLSDPEMVDPQNNAPTEWQEANDKFKSITGTNGIFEDAAGNTSLLSSFLALNQVDDGFRKVLARKATPKAANLSFKSANEAVDSLGNTFIDLLSVSIKNEGAKNGNVQEALDNLTETLGAIEVDSHTLLENSIEGLASGADSRVARFMDETGQRLGAFADKSLASEKNKMKRAAWQSAKLLSAVISKTRGVSMANAMVSYSNQNTNTHTIPFKEGLVEVVGMTDENKAVQRMLNLVKAKVSAVRQHYRLDLPNILNSKFVKALTKEDHAHMFRALGQVDISALGAMKVSDIMDMYMDDKKLLARIGELETKLRATAKTGKGDIYINKSRQLAKFMVTGIAGDNLLRNADAISRLLNTRSAVSNPAINDIKAIDELVTLYAIEGQEQIAKDTMRRLITEEPEGVRFMIHTIADLSAKESKKANGQTTVAKYNRHKGFIPHEAQDGVKLIIADESDYEKMIRQGFIRLGAYTGEGRNIDKTPKAYFYSPVSGKSSYLQGVMQTVQDSYFGVDPVTGRTTSGVMVSGSYTDETVPAVTKWIEKRQGMGNSAQNNPNEALMPVFDDEGNVLSYERSIDPAMAVKVNRNSNLPDMVGAWAGRQSEESLAQEFNNTLVDRLYDKWKEDKITNRENEYVDITTTKDAIWKDTWATIPPATKAYIVSKYGENGGFMVRQDMINNALGYRNASAGDIWTGTTRIEGKVASKLSKEISDIFGMGSFRYVVTGEKALQTAVSTAKDWIVIRSVVVPTMNLASNIQQAANRGVPLRDIFSGLRVFTVEVTSHLRNQKKLKRIEVEINAVGNNTAKLRTLNAQKASILDAERRLSIAPLLAAGEFSTIAEGMTELDESLTTGGYVDWVKNQLDKVPDNLKRELPEGGKTLVEYGLVEPNTSLYQGMSRAVQYGDFLGKAIYYNYLVNTQKMDGQDAMDKVSNEFVNFNINPGRTRSYTESIGLIWFWNFKLRIMKSALSMVRENPIRSLMLTTGVGAAGLDIGSPLTDNFMSVWLDDRLGYSVGWDMLWSFPSLNPWINLTT